MFLYLIAVALLASVHAEPRNRPRFPNGRIIGGKDATIETYPYQISLEAYGHHICGGSIISANYVLTAGHCVENPASTMTVRAGSSYRGRGGSAHQVVKVVRHKEYFENEHKVPFNDIAVLRVKEPFKFDETRQPINMYEKTDVANPGEMAVITGWGETGSGLSYQLQTVSVPIITTELCNKAYYFLGGLPEGQICAAYYGVGGKDACQGDSGGPLAINGRLAGVVSWGNGCAQAYYPGAYTEVAYYRDWIDQNVQYYEVDLE